MFLSLLYWGKNRERKDIGDFCLSTWFTCIICLCNEYEFPTLTEEPSRYFNFLNKIKPGLSIQEFLVLLCFGSLLCFRKSVLNFGGLWQFWRFYMVPRKGIMSLGLSLHWTSMQCGQMTPLCPYACCDVLPTEHLSLAIAFKTWHLKSIIQRHPTFRPHLGNCWLALRLCHSQKYSKLPFLF